jgi:hypothetical protein
MEGPARYGAPSSFAELNYGDVSVFIDYAFIRIL